MFKVLKNFSFVLALAILVIPFVSLADEVNTTQPNFQVPKIYLTNLILNKTDYKIGDIVSGTFTLENVGGRNEGEIYYDISLEGEYGENQLSRYVYDLESHGPVFLNALSKQRFSFKYKIKDSFIDGKNVGIKVRVVTQAGISLAFSDARIKIQGGSPYASFGSANVVIDGKKFLIFQGPIVKENEKATLDFQVQNSFKTALSLSPEITVYKMPEKDKPVSLLKLDKFIIPAGGKVNRSIELPLFNREPGVYYGDVKFYSDDRMAAPILPFRYIVGGDIVTIHSLSIDRESVSAGEGFSLAISYTGEPYDIRATTTSTTSISSKYDLQVVVNDEQGKVIAEYFGPAELNDLGLKKVALVAKEKAKSLRAGVRILNGDKIIASYSSILSVPKPDSTNSFGLSKVYSLMAIISLFLAIIFGIWAFKTNNRIRYIISAVFLIASVLCVLVYIFIWISEADNAQAFNQTSYWSSSTSRSMSISVNAIGNKTPGQGFTVTGSVSFWACQNGVTDIKGTTDNNGSDSASWTGRDSGSSYYFTGRVDYSRNFTAPSTTGTKNINFNDIKVCPNDSNGKPDTDSTCDNQPVIRISGYESYSVVVVNGSCGSANGVSVFTAPTSNLCSAGGPSAVSGAGPWTWTCAGSGNGSTANCSAPLAAVAAPNSFTATALGCGTGVSLSWASSTGATSYKIYRNSSLIATTSARIYTDNSISTSDSYTYYVVANGLSGDSPASNSATVSYLAICGDIFVSCTASSTDKSTYTAPVTVLWKASTTASSVAGYSWAGTDGLSGSSVSVSKLYTIAGMKKASTTVNYNKYKIVGGIVKVLVVGGGGGVGGGQSGQTWNAGGGGGEVVSTTTYAIDSVGGSTLSTVTVYVGGGGIPDRGGGNSMFGSLIARGGNPGHTPNQGGDSGNHIYPGGSWTFTGSGGAGGGGAGGKGFPNGGNAAGNGGPGVTGLPIIGGTVSYGAGGRGGSSSASFDGTANTGTGGGGNMGRGGSGVVFVRYTTADFDTVTGGTLVSSIGGETVRMFTGIGTSTITFGLKQVFIGTGSVTVPCPGFYVFDSNDSCTRNCGDDPYITVTPNNPVLDTNLNCSSFVAKPGATSTLNNEAVWVVGTLPNCPSCYSVWTVNNVQDITANATKTLRYIPTTIGVKNISVYFGSTTASTTGTYGNPCVASTTVIQTGGGIIEI